MLKCIDGIYYNMKYLFLAIPNFCGSTLMYEVLKTCTGVKILTNRFYVNKEFVEGNQITLPSMYNLNIPMDLAIKYRSIEANLESYYTNPNNYDWGYIKTYWDKCWNVHNSKLPVKLQKTPNDVFRVPMMNAAFGSINWILMVRDPYAYAANLLANNKFDNFVNVNPLSRLSDICYHITRVMEVQRDNRIFLGDNSFVISYEDFCKEPDSVTLNLTEWMPELSTIDVRRSLSIKSKPLSPIIDDNESKISSMILKYPNIIENLNTFFKPKEDIIKYWNYSLR